LDFNNPLNVVSNLVDLRSKGEAAALHSKFLAEIARKTATFAKTYVKHMNEYRAEIYQKALRSEEKFKENLAKDTAEACDD
jgi:hypothetical protein